MTDGPIDILDECERAEAAYRACPRWRPFRRKALCDYWLSCVSVLTVFERARVEVQRESRA